MAGAAEDTLKYSKPFQAVETESIASIVIDTEDSEAELKISDKEWIRTLLATITDQDFPLWNGAMSFSLPSKLCSIEFRDGSGKALRVVTVYGAWNLLSVSNGGKSVLGSNRRFSEAVISKLEESQPDYIQKQRKIYGNDLSGKYEKEYRDVLKSDQPGAGQSATRPESKSDAVDKTQPEAEGRSR